MKPLEEFHQNRRSPDGRQGGCRPCHRKVAKSYLADFLMPDGSVWTVLWQNRGGPIVKGGQLIRRYRTEGTPGVDRTPRRPILEGRDLETLRLLRRDAEFVRLFFENKQSRDPRGFVYVITCPSYPDFVKIGQAKDPERRLASYQTATPHADYQLVGWRYFNNRWDGERQLKSLLREYHYRGEWYRSTVEYALSALHSIHQDN